MTTTLRFGLFALDASLVAATAWLLVRRFSAELAATLEQLLAWGLMAVALVVTAGIVLGAAGGLGGPGFLVVHLAAFLGSALLRRSRLREEAAAARALVLRCLDELRRPTGEAVLLAALLVALLGFTLLALWSQPVVFDALTYRLSRVGHWLQTGRIHFIPTDDARLNYMPVGPDLVMAWLLTATASGYQPAAVAQTIGGALLLGATLLLARRTGLGRTAALGAGWLVLGLPNVAPQFTSAYVDLFTAGILAAGFGLWLSALQHGRGSWLGGLAAGLALGSKGTIAYLAPALALAVIWLAWIYRAPVRAWRRTFVGALLGAVLFVGPSAWRNAREFGSPLGPPDFVTWHHGVTPTLGASVTKLRLNLRSALAQLFEPNSQPPWWQAGARKVGEAILQHLPEADPFAFDGLDRRANLQKVYAIGAPDADVVSTGLTVPLLGLAALVTAGWRRKSPDARLVLIWSMLIGGFVLFLHWRVQWHPYLFRFIILAVPWMAVIAAWWIAGLSRLPRIVAWTILTATTAHGFITGTFVTYQSGWPAAVSPAQSTGFYVYDRWREWSRTLGAEAAPLRPHLPMNEPLAAFYRQAPLLPIEPGRLAALGAATAEANLKHLGAGWLLVPAAKFIGQEGQVITRTWLFDGDEQNAFSLAAYRTLRPGEQPAPALYRNRWVSHHGRSRRELLVRTWSDSPVRLELINPNPEPHDFELRSPIDRATVQLAARERRQIELKLPANFPTLITIDSDLPADDPSRRFGANLLPKVDITR